MGGRDRPVPTPSYDIVDVINAQDNNFFHFFRLVKLIQLCSLVLQCMERGIS